VGTIQTFHVLTDGGGMMRVTIARWLGPRGEIIEGHPVIPDVTITTARGPADRGRASSDDSEVTRAVEVLREPPMARPR
jgi:C-terminal processing protease CtpA/Prc